MSRVRRGVRRGLRSLLNRVRPVQVGDHRMFLDPRDILGLARRGEYEPLATRIVQRCLAPGMCMIDVGAHVGYYSLVAAQCVGPEGRVYAFEPAPGNFQKLRRNVAMNGYENVVLENTAVADRVERQHLHLSAINSGDNRLRPAPATRRSTPVETTALDAYFQSGAPCVALIKMDIQGSEERAIRGMERLLAANPGIRILMEFWPAGLRLAGSDPRAVLSALDSHGFTLYEIGDDAHSVAPVDADALLNRLVDPGVNPDPDYPWTNGCHYADLLCTRESIAEILSE